MEEDVPDTNQGGSDASGVRLLLKSRDTGGTDLRIGDLGGHPLNGHGPGGVSDPGGKTTDRTAPAEDNELDMEIHLDGGGKRGGGFLDDGGICQSALENGCTVYCYTITVRPV